MKKITPFLWFDNNCEEAIALYTSVFKHTRTWRVTRCGEAGPGPKGAVMAAMMQMDKLDIAARKAAYAGQ